MGSGTSKKKVTTTTAVIKASGAFKRAGQRTTKTLETVPGENGTLGQNGMQGTTNNSETVEKGPVENGVCAEISPNETDNVSAESCVGGNQTPPEHDTSTEGNGHDETKKCDDTTEKTDDSVTQDKEKDLETEAIIKIQRVFRGHQDRQLVKRESEMAIRIQRRFRRHLSSLSIQSRPEEEKDNESENERAKEELEARREQREQRARAWRDDTPELLRKEYTMEVGEQTKEEFNMFQDEITRLKWKSEQQIERIVYGETHSPRRILFISSNIPKSKQLTEARLEDVVTFNYDFTKETFQSLIDGVRPNLDAYKPGTRARSICFVCQGAPGVLYLLKGRALTVQKLKKESEADQVRFWQSLGSYMSKIQAHESVIHIMGCNVMGNQKGQQLFDELETIARPSIVKIKSPLELSVEGNEMIATYFDVPKYKTWKMRRFSKTE